MKYANKQSLEDAEQKYIYSVQQFEVTHGIGIYSFEMLTQSRAKFQGLLPLGTAVLG